MPEKGLSLFRLKEHFRKYTPLYLAGILICVILSNLLYTTTAPRTPDENALLIYLVDMSAKADPLKPIAEQLEKDLADRDILEVEFQGMMFQDPEVDYNSAMLLMARMAAGDCDIYIGTELSAQYLIRYEIAYPLEEALASGWLSEFNLEPVMVPNSETGEEYIGALKLDSITAFRDKRILNPEGAIIMIASNSPNIEESMTAIETMLRMLQEESNASADNNESEG